MTERFAVQAQLYWLHRLIAPEGGGEDATIGIKTLSDACATGAEAITPIHTVQIPNARAAADARAATHLLAKFANEIMRVPRSDVLRMITWPPAPHSVS